MFPGSIVRLKKLLYARDYFSFSTSMLTVYISFNFLGETTTLALIQTLW